MLMQPTAPNTPPPRPGGQKESTYDFIFNPEQAYKKSLLPQGNNKKQRIIIMAAIAAVVLFLIIIVAGLIGNAGKADTEALVSAAKQQQELIRISKVGQQKAKTQAAKNIAVTTLLALESEQDDMKTAISAAGLKPNAVLKVAPNTKTDEALTSAEQNNRFDEEFLEIITQNLTDYQKSIKTAYEGATSAKLKTALTTQYESANTLAGVSGKTE